MDICNPAIRWIKLQWKTRIHPEKVANLNARWYDGVIQYPPTAYGHPPFFPPFYIGSYGATSRAKNAMTRERVKLDFFSYFSRTGNWIFYIFIVCVPITCLTAKAVHARLRVRKVARSCHKRPAKERYFPSRNAPTKNNANRCVNRLNESSKCPLLRKNIFNQF